MISEHDIERVAILMCEDMGLDPHNYVGMKESDTETPMERQFNSYNLDPPGPIHFPDNGAPPYEIRETMRVGIPTHYGPRWKMFRADAAKAIAGWRAVHKYTLTEC